MDSGEEDTSEQINPVKKKAMKVGSIMAAFGRTATKKNVKPVKVDEEEANINQEDGADQWQVINYQGVKVI